MAKAENIALDRSTYEDPFLDMAATKLPKSFKKLLELCQIFAMTHPQISPIIQKLAEYAITSIVYKGDEEARRQHRDLFEKSLSIMERMIEWGLDYFAYGNAFISISFPFIRFYKCRRCGHEHQAHEVNYTYTGGVFSGQCRRCRGEQNMKPLDRYIKNSQGVNIFRFEPQLITPKYNRVTGQYFYYYTMPADLKRSIEAGDKDIIDTTPVEYLDCVRLKRKMRIKRIFHFKRPTFSGRDMAWGFPLVMPALKDAYLNQVYKKADEVVANEHSVPLRVLYPNPGTQDPMQRLALGSFKSFMSRNIRYWRRDKNAIITSPLPVGVTNIGGDGQAYSTIQARQEVVNEMIGAMMVTRGFVMGGENWSSASISQRVMENSFLNYLRRVDSCLQWVRDEVGTFLSMPPCQVSMKPFKKVDDVQMLNLIIGMAREKKVSWGEVLSRLDLDVDTETRAVGKETGEYAKIMFQELLAQNEANSKAIISQTQAQAQAQGMQELASDVKTRAIASARDVRGQAGKEQARQQIAQQQQQQQQQNPQVAMMTARAQKDSAAAAKDQSMAALYSQAAGAQGPQGQGQGDQGQAQGQTDPRVAELVSQLSQVGPGDQKRILAQIQARSPDLARAVVEAMSGAGAGAQVQGHGQGQDQAQGQQQQQQQQQQQAPGQQAQGQGADVSGLFDRLVSQSRDAEELAGRLVMIAPGQQRQVLLHMSQVNPGLFNRVMSAMNRPRPVSGAGAQGQVQGQVQGQATDMRPQPEKLPPRRTAGG